MPYRHQQFVNGEIYHVVTRAIDNNLLFQDINDYYRGIFSIYEFNNLHPVSIKERRKARARIKKIAAREASARDRVSGNFSGNFAIEEDKRDKMVEILTFCLVPNHTHLLLRQIKDNGITKFMRKTGAGLGGYLNRKYGRKGYVFQDRFSAVHVETDEQLRAVFVYIHINSISLIAPKWKERGIKDPEQVIKFLETYKWSSYLDYIGKKNFPSVTDREFLLEIMEGEEGCKHFVENWIRYKAEIKKFVNLALEE